MKINHTKIINSYHNSINYIYKFKENSNFSIISKFWKEHFDFRPKLSYSINNLLNFRNMGFSYGIGDYNTSIDIENKKYFNSALNNLLENVPENFILSIDESLIGFPYVNEFKGKLYSTSGLTNIGTTYEVHKLIEKYFSKDIMNKIDLCEIGAGWGGVAYNLNHLYDLSTYTIIDLPDNILLSSFFLQNATNHDVYFYTGENNFREKTIIFTLPNYIESIDMKYDIILNTFSLQEMDYKTVQSYGEWIGEHLKEEGIFISINSHDKEGTKKGSHYCFKNLVLVDIDIFRKTPSGFMNSVPYKMVFKNSNKDVNHYHKLIDITTFLYQYYLRLPEEILLLINSEKYEIYSDNINNMYNFFLSSSKFDKFKLIDDFPENIRLQLKFYLFIALEEVDKAVIISIRILENIKNDFSYNKILAILCVIDKKNKIKYLDILKKNNPTILDQSISPKSSIMEFIEQDSLDSIIIEAKKKLFKSLE